MTVSRNLDVLAADGVANGLNPVGRGFVDHHFFFYPCRLGNYSFFIRFGDFNGAICEGGFANSRPGRDRTTVDRHMLGMQRYGFLNRGFHNKPAYTGGAAVYQSLADR